MEPSPCFTGLSNYNKYVKGEMLKVTEKKEPAQRVLLRTLLLLAIFVFLLVGGGNLLLPLGTPGVIIWMLLSVLYLVFLVRQIIGNLYYRCTNCGFVFSMSVFKALISPPGKGKRWRYFWCPRCHVDAAVQVVIPPKERRERERRERERKKEK